MSPITRIGVLTGGGDAPGLNAVIRAVVKTACNAGIEVLGIEDSFDGLIEPGRTRPLGPRDVTGILRLGGTILGTTNRGNPFAYPITTTTQSLLDGVIRISQALWRTRVAGRDARHCIDFEAVHPDRRVPKTPKRYLARSAASGSPAAILRPSHRSPNSKRGAHR